MPIKVLCTGDLHLGTSSSGLFSQGLDVSTAAAWNRVVSEALRHRVELVAIAGDIFDGDGTYLEVAERFAAGLCRLHQEQVPVVAVAGNHDFSALRRFTRTHPHHGLRLLGTDGETSSWTETTIQTRRGDLRVVGWSFAAAEEKRSPQDSFRLTSSSLPTLGLLHGEEKPDSRYAPLCRATLRALPVDAWVLGHIHKPERPTPDQRPCFYPGSPQALDFGPGEMGSHGVILLSLGGTEPALFVPISNAVYLEETTPLDARHGPDQAEEEVYARVRALLEAARDRHGASWEVSIQARLRLGGESAIALTRLRERFPDSPQLIGSDAVGFPLIEPLPPLDGADPALTEDAVGVAVRLLRAMEAGCADGWSAGVAQQAVEAARRVWGLIGVERAAREANIEEAVGLSDAMIGDMMQSTCRRLLAALRSQRETEAESG